MFENTKGNIFWGFSFQFCRKSLSSWWSVTFPPHLLESARCQMIRYEEGMMMVETYSPSPLSGRWPYMFESFCFQGKYIDRSNLNLPNYHLNVNDFMNCLKSPGSCRHHRQLRAGLRSEEINQRFDWHRPTHQGESPHQEVQREDPGGHCLGEKVTFKGDKDPVQPPDPEAECCVLPRCRR